MSFALDLSRAVEKTKGKTELMVKKVMLELFTKVVEKSPVDTGRFRSNWLVGYGSPNLITTLETDKSGSAALGKIATNVSSAKIDGKSIFLTNSLPYSLILENGRENGKPGSLQAPQGMVRISLIEITSAYGK